MKTEKKEGLRGCTVMLPQDLRLKVRFTAVELDCSMGSAIVYCLENYFKTKDEKRNEHARGKN